MSQLAAERMVEIKHFLGRAWLHFLNCTKQMPHTNPGWAPTPFVHLSYGVQRCITTQGYDFGSGIAFGDVVACQRGDLDQKSKAKATGLHELAKLRDGFFSW